MTDSPDIRDAARRLLREAKDKHSYAVPEDSPAPNEDVHGIWPRQGYYGRRLQANGTGNRRAICTF